jgi:hypothetical protein
MDGREGTQSTKNGAEKISQFFAISCGLKIVMSAESAKFKHESGCRFILMKKWIFNYLHRLFPSDLEEFRHAMISYSQFGEDLLIQEILGYERRDIFYIDIRAFHPNSKSNTYIFYRRGGKSICVEPNPSARALWQKFRPRDIFVSKGATGGASCHLNYVTDPGSGAQNSFQTQSNSGSSLEYKIECINIRQLVADLLPAGQSVDLLSVDGEGMDIDLIRNFPFDLALPRVIVVEDFEYSEKSKIHLIMNEIGYKIGAYTKISKIFLDKSVI